MSGDAEMMDIAKAVGPPPGDEYEEIREQVRSISLSLYCCFSHTVLY